MREACCWLPALALELRPGAQSSLCSTVRLAGTFLAQGDKLYSELFNELYQFNFESRRWFPMVVRPPRKQQQQQAAAPDGASSEAAAAAGGQAQDGSSGGGGAAAAGEGRGQQAGALPAGVSQEMQEILQRAMADTNSPFHKAAVRIQSRYRGYVVRKVRPGWSGWMCGVRVGAGQGRALSSAALSTVLSYKQLRAPAF